MFQRMTGGELFQNRRIIGDLVHGGAEQQEAKNPSESKRESADRLHCTRSSPGSLYRSALRMKSSLAMSSKMNLCLVCEQELRLLVE